MDGGVDEQERIPFPQPAWGWRQEISLSQATSREEENILHHLKPQAHDLKLSPSWSWDLGTAQELEASLCIYQDGNEEVRHWIHHALVVWAFCTAQVGLACTLLGLEGQTSEPGHRARGLEGCGDIWTWPHKNGNNFHTGRGEKGLSKHSQNTYVVTERWRNRRQLGKRKPIPFYCRKELRSAAVGTQPSGVLRGKWMAHHVLHGGLRTRWTTVKSPEGHFCSCCSKLPS